MRKFLPTVRLLFLIALMSLPQTNAFSQRVAFLNEKNTAENANQEKRKSLQNLLFDIETDFQVSFNYDDDLIKDLQVTAQRPAIPEDQLDDFLAKLLQPFKLKFVKENNRYLIIHDEKEDIKRVEKLNYDNNLGHPGKTPDKYTVSSLKNRLPGNLAAPLDKTISGKVVDLTDNLPLPGVNVVVKNTTLGGVTDVEGNYKLSLPDDAQILVFSSVGYETEEVAIDNRSVINISLSPDIQSLQEIVVVGYGTQKKSDVTGAISSVSSKEVKELPVVSASEALQGRVAGLDVVSNGGRPGEGVTVRIRGERSFRAGNSPLYVVDGIPMGGGINEINPNDIASIEVLKDASATAIYGSRGANGVVLITTQRGEAGKAIVTYDTYYGQSERYGRIDMMNGAEYAAFKQAAGVDLEPWEEEALSQGFSTDYQNLVYRTGHRQDHQLSVSGGNEKTKFYLSGNYYNEKGIVHKSGYDRYAFRVNVDHQLNDRIKFGTSSLISRSIQDWGVHPVWAASGLNPLSSPYNEDGTVNFSPDGDGVHTNPLASIVGETEDQRKITRIFSSAYGELKILDGLLYRLNVGTDYSSYRRGVFESSFSNSGGTSEAGWNANNEFEYTVENILNYSKAFGPHALTVTGLYSIQKHEKEFIELSVQGLPYETQRFYNLGSANEVTDRGSDLSEWGLMSAMGRIQYSLSDRYLATLTLRADGSSRLAEGHKWGYFPSAALAWRVIEEGFMQNQELLNDLKLRVSYGVIGNTGINPYQTQGTLDRTIYAFGEVPGFGYWPGDIINPDLKWESTASFNVGLDFALLRNRISGSAEFYQQNTSDLLLNRQLPSGTGFTQILQNIGKTRNTGVELTLSTTPVDIEDGFQWTLDMNFFANREEIVELYAGPTDDIGNEWFIGHPIDVWYDFQKEGIWQTNEETEAESYQANPGEIKVEDQDDNGVINGDDRVIVGTPRPKWSGGLTNRFSYRGFDLSVLLFTRQGQTIYSNIHQSVNRFQARHNNLDVDYWTPDNPTNNFPQPVNGQSQRYLSTLYYYDGSFVKIRNITLGYDVPPSLLSKTLLSGLRVYVSAQNPLVFNQQMQSVSIDPEANGSLGINEVPLSRLFLVGLNAKF